MGGQQGAIEGVAAGVALKQLGRLLGRAVLLLDDALDGSVGGQLDAPVAEGLGRGEGEDGRGVHPSATVSAKLRIVRRLDEGEVAVEHDDGAGIDTGRLEGDAHRMAGAQALRLLDALDGGGVLAGVGVCKDGAHLVAVAAHHYDDASGARCDRCVDDPADHRLAEDLVRDLGVVRLHAGALARGHE